MDPWVLEPRRLCGRGGVRHRRPDEGLPLLCRRRPRATGQAAAATFFLARRDRGGGGGRLPAARKRSGGRPRVMGRAHDGEVTGAGTFLRLLHELRDGGTMGKLTRSRCGVRTLLEK
ncbi:hypothetical protein ACP4OV_007039 [Aristida adscensionis]